MAQLRAMVLLSCCMLGLASPTSAQDSDRIWGRVLTASGEEYEGFLRWPSTEGSWLDVLEGTKDIPQENYRAWLAANDEERALRVIELRGHRVSWEEEHPDFPLTVPSGVRFGHLASIEVIGSDRVGLVLRSGQTIELQYGGNVGFGRRRLVVDTPGEPEASLRLRDLERVVFSAAPPGARATSRRLYGTAEDELGRRFVGYVAWDLDEVLGADVLQGEDIDGGREHEIRFDEIESIERMPRGAQVLLTRGDTLELTGRNDVDDGNRGIQISDLALGTVEIEWEAFHMLRFHEAEQPVTYDAFDGGSLLRGTVVMQDGTELDGLIRWNADEAASWEFLDGRQGEVAFKIEMGHIGRIERGEALGARVTLIDGRSFALDDSNDVDWDNRGIMVAPQGADTSDASVWRVVAWDEFREVQFR